MINKTQFFIFIFFIFTLSSCLTNVFECPEDILKTSSCPTEKAQNNKTNQTMLFSTLLFLTSSSSGSGPYSCQITIIYGYYTEYCRYYEGSYSNQCMEDLDYTQDEIDEYNSESNKERCEYYYSGTSYFYEGIYSTQTCEARGYTDCSDVDMPDSCPAVKYCKKD